MESTPGNDSMLEVRVFACLALGGTYTFLESTPVNVGFLCVVCFVTANLCYLFLSYGDYDGPTSGQFV